ncbi:hypothetical protein [Calycomorphotria hydatis]|uniref:HD domain-containing protein n=1 Tax=Calycomorphotria hydatis TaxID=2528027 RepID=A0A517T6B3_9PLAN|nr:hypothetical protein [Calycomorphotria hydatis]QDT63913.1 hypothetical protein V22_11410 [Calycomorphotria hydatis]
MPANIPSLPFEVETELERAIISDLDWLAGANWGEPRPGHPEGTIKSHIAEVLSNVDKYYLDNSYRESLRLIALVHDTFKHQVDESLPRSGENHHAMRARRFAERYLDHETDDAILEIIELHDEAYNSWQRGNRDGRWDKAEERATRLLSRLGDSLPLYLAFYQCDNETGDKDQSNLEWFREFVDSVRKEEK